MRSRRASRRLAALDELPGPRFGAHWLVWWWFIMLLVTVFQLGAMVGGVGQALNLAFPQVAARLADGVEAIVPWLADRRFATRPEHPWAVLTALAAIGSAAQRRLPADRAGHDGARGRRHADHRRLRRHAARDGLSDWLGRSADRAFRSRCCARRPAIAAAFGTFGITGVGASELYAYPYWCLEKGYARFTGPRIARRRVGRAGPRLDSRDVSRRLGEHGRVHRGDGGVLRPGANGAAPAGPASREVADDRHALRDVRARVWRMDARSCF